MIKILSKLTKFIILGLILVAILLIIIGIFSVARETSKIPPETTLGMTKPFKIFGHFKLSDWHKFMPDNSYITIFQGKLIESGKTEIRAYYSDENKTIYIGSLKEQFGVSWLKTIFIDLRGERVVVGWITPEVKGKLYAFHLERPELDRTLWMNAEKESTIEKNLFIMPIVGTDVELWNKISMIAVQTKESLKQGFDGNGSYYEVEKKFDPAINISAVYNIISTK